jgi:hypothetical protein
LGPQATNWTRESLSDLQGRITADDRNKGLLGFLKQAVTELPSLWPLIDQSLGSRLDFLPGAVDFAPETLAQLAEFANGTGTLDPQRLTNTALAPLTVVAQIIDFVQTTASPGSEEGLAGLASVQGFCIGFLSAAALASATTWAEFEHNAANAIRLAACVGIIVDAYEAWRPADDRVAALSVRWKTEADRTFLETCLDQVPGVSNLPSYYPTYVSERCFRENEFVLTQCDVVTRHMCLVSQTPIAKPSPSGSAAWTSSLCG